MADTKLEFSDDGIHHENTIHFDDDMIRPIRSHDARSATATGNDVDGGIVFSRAVSRARSSLSRVRSVERRFSRVTIDASDEAGIRHPGDVRHKQTFQGTQLFFLAYQSIGVIYGDIGTSPLYVLSGVFTAPPSYNDLVGVLSLIIWSLLMIVTLKYVIIILHADNEGEGGTFSCYSLLSRYANITNRDVREEPMVRMERHRTNELPRGNRTVRKAMESNSWFRGMLKVIGVLAVSMVMSDGVLTPAQSVLGAVQGLNVIVPNISQSTVIGTTCGILVLLFLIQPFGTTKIGVAFAPIIIIWLGVLAGYGIFNLVHYDASVFRAFNPGEAFSYLIRHGTDGWLSLGGVLLAFTGVEALFADLGAFSMRAIQISWLGYCLPCLLLTYLGQAAYLSVHPDQYGSPVFNTVPPGCLIFTMVLAVLAAIVASQAIITASFQLLAQIVKLSYFPQIEVRHVSKTFHNQLYVPLVNYLLCIGTVVIVVAYQNTTALGNAYGACVAFVSFFDTQFVSLAALIVWRVPPYYVVLPWLAISAMDGAFLSSALTKVPQGAWFTITLAAVLAFIFILWRFGKEQQWRAERDARKPMAAYLTRPDADGAIRLTSVGHEELSITRGFGIFFDKGGEKAPMVFSQFVNKLVSKPEVTVFFHLRPLESPTVPEDERYIVQKIEAIPDCYRVVARFGYMDEVVTPDMASLIFARIRDFLIKENAYASHGAGERSVPVPVGSGVPTVVPARVQELRGDADLEKKSVHSEPAATEISLGGGEEPLPLSLARLEQAFEHRVLYIIGKEEMHVAPKTKWWRLVLLKIFMFARDNTRTKISNLKVPTDRLVEIGFVLDV